MIELYERGVKKLRGSLLVLRESERGPKALEEKHQSLWFAWQTESQPTGASTQKIREDYKERQAMQ